MSSLYPIFTDLADRLVVVIGGGQVALRKVERLLECEAKVMLISPEINEELVAVLCESQDLVLEMVDVIQEHNRPLASRTSGTSGTSQKGS